MTLALIVIIALVVLAGILVASTLRGRDADAATGRLARETLSRDRGTVTITETDVELSSAVTTGREVERTAALARREGSAVVKAESAEITQWVAPDPEQTGQSRRQFLNRSIVGSFALGLGGFGGGVLAFLWPPFVTGFGAEIQVGKVSDIIQGIRDAGGFLYRPDGRMWLTEYPAGAIEKARGVYSAGELSGMEAGVIALFQKCPHLGCRVPECLTSQWFECPCHGSKYNRVGEKRGGPAPRGMDRFEMVVSGDGVLTVKTGSVIQGPAIGVNTTGQEAEGPNCIGEATH
ncbi:MAG: Rieske 2Fe-2S domain-containing protein [Actinomycetota bacterium]